MPKFFDPPPPLTKFFRKCIAKGHLVSFDPSTSYRPYSAYRAFWLGGSLTIIAISGALYFFLESGGDGGVLLRGERGGGGVPANCDAYKKLLGT